MKGVLAFITQGVLTIATVTGVLQMIFVFVSIVGVVITTYIAIKKYQNSKKEKK